MKKEWLQSEREAEIQESFEKTFTFETLVIEFIDILIAYLISIIIEVPLSALAHFIITFEWVFFFNIFSYFLFIGSISLIILLFYFIFKPLREKIEQVFILEKKIFYKRLISLVFALLVIDVFIEIAYYISNLAVNRESALDLILIMEKIIASLILLIFVVIVYFILRRREVKKYGWLETYDGHPISEKIGESFKSTFSFKYIALEFIDIFIAYIISLAIEQPLFSVSHFIRTGEWIYELNIASYLIFIGILISFILIFYLIFKHARKEIYNEFTEQKRFLYEKIISLIFAFLIIDIFEEFLLFISNLPFSDSYTLNLGFIMDNLITSLILLQFFILIYIIYEKIND